MGKKLLLWDMDLATATEFYERCKARNVTTSEGQNEVLMELAKEGKIKGVMETERTPDQVAKDMAKNFGNVLYVKGKKDVKQKD